MKKLINHKLILAAVLLICISSSVWAGNKDRAGQMGATELNVNPWARSSALFYSNSSYITGIEALKLNPAGLAKYKGLEVGVSFNQYLQGTDINIVDGAFAIDLNEDSKLGINFMTFNFGETNLATVASPEQDLTFSPSFFNAGITYAREFSENVSFGVQATILNESFNEAKASSLSFDAGIQYQGGANNNTHFGIVLRNFGPNFKFSGDGFNNQTVDDNGNSATRSTNTNNVYLPTQFILSGSHDWFLGMAGQTDFDRADVDHIISAMFSFTSNAYYNDHFGFGVEYSMKDKFFLRGAYRYENQIFNANDAQTSFSGLAAGLGLKIYLDKEEKASPIVFDYGYRFNRFNNGIHTISLKYAIN